MYTKNTVQPLVSCIMPTYNRRAFVPHAIRYFLRQDYLQKELIIIDDGSDNVSDLIPDIENIRYYRLDKKITLGAKMNLACTYAKGNIISNWDDDDWYAERRLSYQINAILQKDIAVCGINKLLYYDLRDMQGYQYIYPANQKVWLLGSSLCFTKELWKRNSFADINVGMDGLFVWATPTDQIKVLEDNTFAVHMIHGENVSPKNTKGGYWHSYPVEDIQEIMNTDWNCYINDGFHNGMKSPALKEPFNIEIPKTGYKLLKNVYACLVHENEDCIIDLVRNLHYHDSESVILLYNGSDNPVLLSKSFPYEKYGAVIHPSPVPQKHGYLHKFALDCMEYALEKIPFDIFTNVDSDQLAIRPGYNKYLSEFFPTVSNVGMLSSNPERVFPDNKINHVAVQAFKEFDLWKPLLNSFPDGEHKFVHWTFWPSTVFTSAASRDLVKIFKENKLLQQIMMQTKIWATEEVIFPTLIKLLGYEIAANPCNYDFVKYRQNYTVQDINSVLQKTDSYWIHPIESRYDNPLRTFIRKHFSEYKLTENHLPSTLPSYQKNNEDNFIINYIKNENVGILILHYNTPELTEALCRMIGAEAIVIDNGSDYNNRYQGKNECIRLDKNWGFTIGWNLAIKQVYDRFDAFWLMNSDIEITKESIVRIRQVMADHPDIGMITPSYNCWIRLCQNLGTGTIRQVKCLEFTAPVIRKSVFEKIGFFDEQFTRGFGVDFDFAIRMLNAGLKTFVDDGSSFIHKQHTTISLHEGVSDYTRRAIMELKAGMSGNYGPAWQTIVKTDLELTFNITMKTAVYTTIFGDYTPLLPIPVQSEDADYFCITDNPKLKGEGWTIICPDIPRIDLHPRLRAKFFKMFPWECDELRNYETLIFIDGSIEITSKDFLKYCIDHFKSDLLLFQHPERNCIYDEVKASIGLVKYQKENLLAQEKFYRAFHPEKYGLYACGIIVRKNTERVKSLMAAWWWENIKYSWQDQISFPVVCRLLKITPSVFPDKQNQNRYFRIHWHDDVVLQPEKRKYFN